MSEVPDPEPALMYNPNLQGVLEGFQEKLRGLRDSPAKKAFQEIVEVTVQQILLEERYQAEIIEKMRELEIAVREYAHSSVVCESEEAVSGAEEDDESNDVSEVEHPQLSGGDVPVPPQKLPESDGVSPVQSTQALQGAPIYAQLYPQANPEQPTAAPIYLAYESVQQLMNSAQATAYVQPSALQPVMQHLRQLNVPQPTSPQPFIPPADPNCFAQYPRQYCQQQQYPRQQRFMPQQQSMLQQQVQGFQHQQLNMQHPQPGYAPQRPTLPYRNPMTMQQPGYPAFTPPAYNHPQPLQRHP